MTSSLAIVCLSVITFAVGKDFRTWTGAGRYPVDDPRRESSLLFGEKMPNAKTSLLPESGRKDESSVMEFEFGESSIRRQKQPSELPSISTVVDTISRAIQLWWEVGKKAMNLLAMTSQKHTRPRKAAPETLPHWPGMLWQNDDEDIKKTIKKRPLHKDFIESQEVLNRLPFKSKKKKYIVSEPSDPQSEPEPNSSESELQYAY